jgi:2-polyprenyl-6-methoxyphenol hydroxylase-like FAD-dependent oxidoreductase
MADVIVLGGSLAGLSTAMMLSRRGHRVTVVERGEAAPQDKQTALTDWTRPPQHRHSHVLLTRGVQVLREELPDVLEDLIDHGANHVPMFAFLPPPIQDREPRPGDVDLETLCVRRPVVDWALDRALARDDLTVHRELARDLVMDGTRVTGVRTETQTLTADLVVDAGGRRSRVPRWLQERGFHTEEHRSPCGCTYLTRAFRGEAPGPYLTGFGTFGPGDGFDALVFRGDEDTFTISLQIHADDEDLMVARDNRAFDAIIQALPWTKPYYDAAEAITDVSVMAGLDNTSKRLAGVQGLLQVGDSAATSNPTLGRGMSLALMGAQLITEVIDSDDPLNDLTALRADHIDPFIDEAWGIDERAIAKTRHRLYGEPLPELPPYPTPEEAFPFFITEREAWHRSIRKGHLLAHPSTLWDDELTAKVLAARQSQNHLSRVRSASTAPAAH